MTNLAIRITTAMNTMGAPAAGNRRAIPPLENQAAPTAQHVSAAKAIARNAAFNQVIMLSSVGANDGT
jgi:hypothetical protein